MDECRGTSMGGCCGQRVKISEQRMVGMCWRRSRLVNQRGEGRNI